MQDSQDWIEELLKKFWSTTRRYLAVCSTVILYNISSVVMLGYVIFWLVAGGKLD